ncbi:hypothetical protein Poly51_15460 [Rubripirellula tenax]|uniref:Uncharacterized protein n=2 Tax=Rubripirellula tenax TaxID=2528015 RepID=A0A5C6FF61_9BACT|nr:hypothetical protein Poly51_15460 [Rubripirellula tenax]
MPSSNSSRVTFYDAKIDFSDKAKTVMWYCFAPGRLIASDHILGAPCRCD